MKWEMGNTWILSHRGKLFRWPKTQEHFTCPVCGPHVAVDEDGCCVHCGADAVIEVCDCEYMGEEP